MERLRNLLASLKTRARALKRDVFALALAYRDPRTPWHAKAWAALVVAYALSPIDLIPDFIPILGYLDDLVLIPLGVTLALRLVPPEVMAEARRKAEDPAYQPGKLGYLGAALIGLVWLVVIAAVIRALIG